MSSDFSRREFFAAATALGIGTPTFHRAVAAEAAQQPKGEAVTAEMVKNAEWISGVTLTDEQRTAVAQRLTGVQTQLAALRKTEIGYDVAPAMHFNPTPWDAAPKTARGTVTPTRLKDEVKKPADDADLAFLPLHQLAELVRTKKVSSAELTKLSLARLTKYDPALLCV